MVCARSSTSSSWAIPQGLTAVQSIWDHPTSDADVHMLRGGDSRVYRDTNLDCFYQAKPAGSTGALSSISMT